MQEEKRRRWTHGPEQKDKSLKQKKDGRMQQQENKERRRKQSKVNK
jgi:hypothetical protein